MWLRPNSLKLQQMHLAPHRIIQFPMPDVWTCQTKLCFGMVGEKLLWKQKHKVFTTVYIKLSHAIRISPSRNCTSCKSRIWETKKADGGWFGGWASFLWSWWCKGGFGDGSMAVESEGQSYFAIRNCGESSAICTRESGMSTAVALVIHFAESGLPLLLWESGCAADLLVHAVFFLLIIHTIIQQALRLKMRFVADPLQI